MRLRHIQFWSGNHRTARTALAACAAAAAALLTLFAAPDGAHAELRVAAFSCDVTPAIGQPLYHQNNVVRKVELPLLAKGVVIQSGGERYVLCAVDACRISNGSHLSLRRKLAAAAGTDVSRAAVQTVHQHSASWIDVEARNMLAEIDEKGVDKVHLRPEVIDEIEQRIVQAVEQSIGRLEPFDRVGVGSAKVDRVASSRRVAVESGKIVSRSSTCGDKKLRDMPEGLIDPCLKTITFARGETPLVRLHYYATHPQTRYHIDVAGSDVAGMARDAVEQSEGVPQIYFTGCAGDVAMGKYNDGSDTARKGLAERLTAGIKASIAATRYAPAGAVKWRTFDLRLTPRTDAGFSIEDCLATLKDPKLAMSRRLTRGALCLVFHERCKSPVELSSLRIGNVFILHLPGEPMVHYQLYAQRLRPDCFVAVAGYGDGGPAYICTKKAFSDKGGYEQNASNVVPETETALKNAIAALLGAESASKAECR